MVMTVPTNTPLQQQIDEFIAEGASWLPTNLLQDLLSPIGQLINSGAAENALKEGAQAPDFALPDARGTAVRLSHLLLTWPVSARVARGMARISHPLSPARSRNGSRWFTVSDQAEKNRSVKKALL